MIDVFSCSGVDAVVGVLSCGVLDMTGEVGTDGSDEKLVLDSGEVGMLLLGSENKRLRWLLVARRAFSPSDGM